MRWRRSYEYQLSKIQRKLGVGRYGLRLGLYRSVFHVIGAALVICTATLVSHALWGTDVALPVLFVMAMAVITYQEFFIQPRIYKQHLAKGVLDWVSWVAPLCVYFFFYL